MADLEKVLGKTGAKNFWNKVWSNVKVLTGDVAYKTKGDLQTQVTAATNTASTAKTTAEAAKTVAATAQTTANTAKETAEMAKNQTGGLTFAQDADGNWGYKVGGADPVIPFKKGDMNLIYLGSIAAEDDSLDISNIYPGYKNCEAQNFLPVITGASYRLTNNATVSSMKLSYDFTIKYTPDTGTILIVDSYVNKLVATNGSDKKYFKALISLDIYLKV